MALAPGRAALGHLAQAGEPAAPSGRGIGPTRARGSALPLSGIARLSALVAPSVRSYRKISWGEPWKRKRAEGPGARPKPCVRPGERPFDARSQVPAKRERSTNVSVPKIGSPGADSRSADRRRRPGPRTRDAGLGLPLGPGRTNREGFAIRCAPRNCGSADSRDPGRSVQGDQAPARSDKAGTPQVGRLLPPDGPGAEAHRHLAKVDGGIRSRTRRHGRHTATAKMECPAQNQHASIAGTTTEESWCVRSSRGSAVHFAVCTRPCWRQGRDRA